MAEGDETPPTANARLNALAATIQSSWPEHVPLSVRFGAARAADEIVQSWFDGGIDVDVSDRGVESRVSAERCRAATEAALEMFRQNWTALHVDDGARLESMIHCALVAAGVADLSAALGESLMRTRLAMTALDLGDPGECNAILSALCRVLVDAGAVDPMEAE